MKDRIKVIRLVPMLDYGGVEMITAIQAQLHDRERFELRVCTFWHDGQTAQQIRQMGVPVDVLEVDPAVRNPVATLRLWTYLMRVRPDVLHATAAEAMFHGAIAGALSGIPVRIIEDIGMPSRGKLGSAIFGLLGHTVQQAIGCSAATCDFLVEQDRMPASRVSVVYNCGKPEFFGPVTRERPATPRPFRVLAVGRLVPVKNHLVLIEAMRQLVHEDGLDVTLTIAGEGEMRSKLEHAIDVANLQGHVELVGFRDDVRALLDGHDLFAISSLTEGSSIALIEAMATAIPVITSSAQGLLEVLGDFGSDDALSPHDASAWRARIAQMMAWSPRQLADYGEAGRAHAFAHFSPARHIEQLEALYRTGSRRGR